MLNSIVLAADCRSGFRASEFADNWFPSWQKGLTTVWPGAEGFVRSRGNYPLDPRVRTLMQIRFEDQDFRPFQDDFRFMAIPTDIERLEAAQALETVIGLPALNEKAEFCLVVMNHTGVVVAKIDASQICVGNELSKERLLAELEKHKTVPLDARDLLEKALSKATVENKRILVQETATWCGPCHLFSRLLQANRQWEKDYVWVKMDHRWTGALEIMKELREGADGGIPWFVILDASGKKLATSNLPDSGRNIGFLPKMRGKGTLLVY